LRVCFLLSFAFTLPRPPTSTLFPYTTLFRSRRRGADLPDHQLPVPRHRARLQPVRAEGTRQHLHPHHEPDRRRVGAAGGTARRRDRKSTRLNSSHVAISYAVFCLKKKKIM